MPLMMQESFIRYPFATSTLPTRTAKNLFRTTEGPIAYISTGGGGSTTVGTGSKLPRFSYNRPKAAEYVHVGGFFQNANPRSRSHFIIHPDWVSETFST